MVTRDGKLSAQFHRGGGGGRVRGVTLPGSDVYPKPRSAKATGPGTVTFVLRSRHRPARSVRVRPPLVLIHPRPRPADIPAPRPPCLARRPAAQVRRREVRPGADDGYNRKRTRTTPATRAGLECPPGSTVAGPRGATSSLAVASNACAAMRMVTRSAPVQVAVVQLPQVHKRGSTRAALSSQPPPAAADRAGPSVSDPCTGSRATFLSTT